MTTLEIILSLILYILIGLWITYKRNWYKSSILNSDGDIFTFNLFAVLLMPFNLIIVILREFIIREWNNDDPI